MARFATFHLVLALATCIGAAIGAPVIAQNGPDKVRITLPHNVELDTAIANEEYRHDRAVAHIKDNARRTEDAHKQRLAAIARDHRLDGDGKARRRAEAEETYRNERRSLERRRALEGEQHAQNLRRIRAAHPESVVEEITRQGSKEDPLGRRRALAAEDDQYDRLVAHNNDNRRNVEAAHRRRLRALEEDTRLSPEGKATRIAQEKDDFEVETRALERQRKLLDERHENEIARINASYGDAAVAGVGDEFHAQSDPPPSSPGGGGAASPDPARSGDAVGAQDASGRAQGGQALPGAAPGSGRPVLHGQVTYEEPYTQGEDGPGGSASRPPVSAPPPQPPVLAGQPQPGRLAPLDAPPGSEERARDLRQPPGTGDPAREEFAGAADPSGGKGDPGAETGGRPPRISDPPPRESPPLREGSPLGPAATPTQTASRPSPAHEDATPAEKPVLVFNYFYINGINTPAETRDAQGRLQRGNCTFEHSLVAQNLVDIKGGEGVRLITPHPPGLPPIKVADETDVMGPKTCNASGTDAHAAETVRRDCESIEQQLAASRDPVTAGVRLFWRQLCHLALLRAQAHDQFRKTGFIVGMSPGDLYESVRQSLNVARCVTDFFHGICHVLKDVTPQFARDAVERMVQNIARHTIDEAHRYADVEWTAEQEVVQTVVGHILRIYRSERAQTGTRPRLNLFIVVGHSQGNFFTEAVGYRLANLEGEEGLAVFNQRLGLYSLASPTRYNRLPDWFLASRVIRATRRDDGIRVLEFATSKALAGVGKHPWPEPYDRPLWKWKPDRLTKILNDPKAVLAHLGLRPDVVDDNPEKDGALLTPLMNAHLLENYLTEPTATDPCRPLRQEVVDELVTCAGDRSPETTEAAILRSVRDRLVDLKKGMIADIEREPRTSSKR